MREVGGSLAKAAFDLLMSSQPSTLHNMIFIKQTYIRNHTKQLLVTTAIMFIPFGLLAPKDFLMTNYLAFQYYDLKLTRKCYSRNVSMYTILDIYVFLW